MTAILYAILFDIYSFFLMVEKVGIGEENKKMGTK